MLYMVLDLILKSPRYDMGVGNSKAIGKHEDLATCIEYSEEKCKILVEYNPLVICSLLPFLKDVHESGVTNLIPLG